MRCINQSFTTRIAHVDGIPLSVPLWQFLHKSTRGRPPPAAVSVGGGRRDGRGAAGLRALQVAGVAEEVAVQRVAAVTLLVVQLHLTALTVIAFHMVVFVHGYNSNGFIRPL